MKDNNEFTNKSIGFFDWLSNTFSKPYLILIFWWMVINLDFILILLGRYDIWIDIQLEYGGILKTAVNNLFNLNPRENYFFYFLISHIALPIAGTVITIALFSWVIKPLELISISIGLLFKRVNQRINDNSANKIKDQSLKISEEYANQQQQLIKVLESYENIKDINKEINSLLHPKGFKMQVIDKGNDKVLEFRSSTFISRLKLDLKDSKTIPPQLADESYHLIADLEKHLYSIQNFLNKLSEKKLEVTKKVILQELASNLSMWDKIKLLFNRY